MPQLVKGGKHTFGWSKVSKEGKILIPPEAFLEYQFIDGEKAILMSGSKRSGGFGLTTARRLKASSLAEAFTDHPELFNYEIKEGVTVIFNSRTYCWILIKNQSLTIPPETLQKYGIQTGDSLLTVRGSNLALGFIVKGPIIEEAKKHPQLQVYK